MILFITRKYPPSVGGMERLSFQVTTGVAAQEPAALIAWGGRQTWLPFFFIYAGLKALWLCATRPIDLIHISDVALALLGWLLRGLTRRPVIVNAHGLDVIYPKRLYQAIVVSAARRLDHVICNSEHTRRQCLERGITAVRTTVIPVGIDAGVPCMRLADGERDRWLARWGVNGAPLHILLTVGRLVPRKGVRWFVAEVLPRLADHRDDWVYLIIGDGPERRAIAAAAADPRVTRRVHLLGRVSEADLRTAYAIADLFIMPNVPVPGDSEGFGIVHLEARAAGLPVVAAAIEGIAESFVSEEDGWLTPAGDAPAFVAAIERVLDTPLSFDDRTRRAARIAAQYDWPHIVVAYRAVFRDVRARRTTT